MLYVKATQTPAEQEEEDTARAEARAKIWTPPGS